MAALDGGSLAYLTIREGEHNKGRYWEVGVIGHGKGGACLAERVVDENRAWDASGGNDARFVIDKPYSRLVIDWPVGVS